MDEDEEEDKDEDDGKESGMIGQGEMVNSADDNVDTMVDEQPIVIADQGQEIGKHTLRPQPREPALRPQTPERHAKPRTPHTHPLSGLQDLGLVTARKPPLAQPSLREAEAARNTSEVDVDQKLPDNQQLATVPPMSHSPTCLSLISLWLRRAQMVL